MNAWLIAGLLAAGTGLGVALTSAAFMWVFRDVFR